MELWSAEYDLDGNYYFIQRHEVSEKQLKALRKTKQLNVSHGKHEDFDDAAAELRHRRACDLDRAQALVKEAQSYMELVQESSIYIDGRQMSPKSV